MGDVVSLGDGRQQGDVWLGFDVEKQGQQMTVA